MTDVSTYKDVSNLVALETTWGTRAAPTKDIGLIQNVNPREANTLERLHVVGSRNVDTFSANKYDASISVEFVVQNGRMLNLALGTLVHDETNTPDIKHTFAESNNISSFTYGTHHDIGTDIPIDFLGCKINTTTISLDNAGQLTQRCEIVAKNSTNGSTATSPVISTLPPLPAWSSVLQSGAAGSEGPITLVRNHEITLNNTLIMTEAVGSRLLGALEPSTRDYDGRFTIALANDSQHGEVLGGTTPSSGTPAEVASMIFSNSRGTLGTDLRELYINIKNVNYEAVNQPVTIGSITYWDFDFFAKTISNAYTYDNIGSDAWF